MVMTDRQIKMALKAGWIMITPEPIEVQPASVDVHLGADFMALQRPGNRAIDPRDKQSYTKLAGLAQYMLAPGGFALGELAERVTLDNRHAARIEGKSSLGRNGLGIHVTAGWVDPGWDGVLTLELHNFTQYPMVLTPGMKIAQLAFYRLDHAVDRPYGSSGLGSHYQNQEGVVGSAGVASSLAMTQDMEGRPMPLGYAMSTMQSKRPVELRFSMEGAPGHERVIWAWTGGDIAVPPSEFLLVKETLRLNLGMPTMPNRYGLGVWGWPYSQVVMAGHTRETLVAGVVMFLNRRFTDRQFVGTWSWQ